MNLEMSYIDYLGFLVIDFFKSVLMYSKGAICLSRLLFKMGLFTVQKVEKSTKKLEGRLTIDPSDRCVTRAKFEFNWHEIRVGGEGERESNGVELSETKIQTVLVCFADTF